MRRGKFEKFNRKIAGTNRIQGFYFRLKSGNGEIIAQSESYSTAQARDKGIAAVRRVALFAKVEEMK